MAKAAEELKEGMQQLAKLDPDPMGLKKLMDGNAELRDALQQIQTRIQGASEGLGVITLKDRHLRLKVAHYSGEFRFNAWVDTDTNWVWKDRHLGYRGLTKPSRMEPENAWNTWARETGIFGSKAGVAENVWGTILIYNRQWNLAFDEMVKESHFSDCNGPDTIDIEEQVLAAGAHKVSFVVTLSHTTPLRAGHSGDRSIRWQAMAPNLSSRSSTCDRRISRGTSSGKHCPVSTRTSK